MRIPFRWALPIFHLAVDLVLTTLLVVQLLAWINHPSESGFNRRPYVAASYNPQVRYVLDPRSPGSIGASILLITGTLPAGIISSMTLFATRGQLDIPYGCLIWFGLFESLAIPMWFFAGRTPAAYSWCIASIGVRVLASLTVVSRLWGWGAGLQFLFWVSAMLYTFAVGARWIIKRFRLNAPFKKPASGEQL
jgi:hypothetical protein